MKKEAKSKNGGKTKNFALKDEFDCSKKSMQKCFLALALKLNALSIMFFLLLSPFAFADGRTNEPSHQTLFSNVITSYTDANAVTIADAQGLVTTGKVSIGTASTIDEGLTIAHSTGAIGLRPSGQSGVQIRNNAGRFEVNTGSGNEFVVLQNGNVGIGTMAPEARLHVYDGASGLMGNDIGEVLKLENDGNTYIQLATITGGETGIDSRSNDNSKFAGIFFDHGSQPHMRFKVASAEKMRITSSGRVGIGTTSPAEKIEIYDPSSTGNAKLQLTQDTHDYAIGVDTSGSLWGFGIWLEDESQGFTIDSNKGVGIGSYATQGVGVSLPADGLVVSGNVGIGTVSPSGKLDVSGNFVISSVLSPPSFTVGHIGTRQLGFRADDSGNSQFWFGPANAQTRTYGAQLVILGPNAAADWSKRLTLERTAANYAKISTDSGDLALMPSGNVGIGTTNPNDGKVEVKGGTVCVDTNSDDLATSCIAAESDIRLKKNITPIINALEKIQKINGVTFDWRWDEYEQIQRFKAKPRGMGVIAQEVEDVFPEAMNEEIGSFKSVDKEALVAPLIEAVKELKAENEALNSEIKELKKRLGALENKK